jgi:hypothetical protein
MNQMKRHLQKDDKNLLPNPLAIESNRREIGLKIKNMMQPQSQQIPSVRSYEKIITDRIGMLCPTLRGIHILTPSDIGIYIDTFIFDAVFDTIVTESELILTIEQANDDMKKVQYKNKITLGQGTEASMERLKQAIETLGSDDEILARINEYNELRNQSINDEQIKQLKMVSRILHTEIHGGAVLWGYPACNLCDPDVPVDTSNIKTERPDG